MSIARLGIAAAAILLLGATIFPPKADQAQAHAEIKEFDTVAVLLLTAVSDIRALGPDLKESDQEAAHVLSDVASVNVERMKYASAFYEMYASISSREDRLISRNVVLQQRIELRSRLAMDIKRIGGIVEVTQSPALVQSAFHLQDLLNKALRAFDAWPPAPEPKK